MADMTSAEATTAEAAAHDFNVHFILEKSFEVYLRNFIPFSLLMALITAPLFFLELQAVSSDPVLSWSPLFLDRLNTLLRLVLPYAAGAILIFGTVQELRGQRASFGECVRRGIVAFIPVLGVVFIVSLAILVGIVLLVIPGLVVMTMLWVAIPVAVVERPGVIATLHRSSALTRGYRWRVFGIIVALVIIAGGAGLIIGFASLIFIDPVNDPHIEEIEVVLGYAIDIVFSGIGAVSVAVSYHLLRSAKEGIDIEEIAKVFD